VTTPRAYVFDAYGTLFDVHSVIEAGRSVTPDPQALSTLWRQKQLDAVKIFKPSPRVYELGPRAFGVPAGEILFVSSNGWDVAGAKSFGYRTCWCNRQRAPAEALGVTADYEVQRLDEISEKLGLHDSRTR